jgi:Na+-driven multidrug efflux pump
MRGLGLQAAGSKVVLFSFYGVSLPSAYVYSIHMKMGLNGLVLGITSGSFTFAVLNFIILKFFVNWRKLTKEIHIRMREAA